MRLSLFSQTGIHYTVYSEQERKDQIRGNPFTFPVSGGANLGIQI